VAVWKQAVGSAPHYMHQVLVSRELGGAAMNALHLAEFLRRQGYATHVWSPGEGPAQERAKELGLVTHVYDVERVFSPSKITAVIGNHQISRALQPFRPGIVHIHSPLYYAAMRFGLRGCGLKSVAHVQITTPPDDLRWAFKYPPALIITCAQYLVDAVRGALPAAYQKRQWVECVPNAVDMDRFHPGDKAAAKRQVGAQAARPLALMLANLAPHKGQETAIHIAAALKQDGVHMVFWLAGTERGGEEHYTAHLRALCHTSGVTDRVHLLGHRHDAPDLLRAADFFLLPSTDEGLPLSILEAQATKLPVLAAPTAGIPEAVIHEKTGFLIPAKDVAGFAYWLKRLLDDRAMYQKIATQAYAKVQQEYSWKNSCDRLLDMYRQLQM
jgi:glycosyltransferase involved in cell wall biosynthesis